MVLLNTWMMDICIWMLHSFHTPMIAMYKKYNDVLIGSPLLFIRDTTYVKSIRIEQNVNREPIAFCTRRYTCKKYKDTTGHQLVSACFLYALVHWPCMHLVLSPWRQSGTLCVIEPPKNEGFVSQDHIGGFSVKQEYTNKSHKAYNTRDMKFK